MSTDSLLLAIIGHLVGDYLLQTDWMAQNKKIRAIPNAVHCTIWTLSVLFFSGWQGNWIFLALYVPHCIQDGTNIVHWWMTLRWKNQSAFTQPPFAPWSLIVVDNVWHILTLWAVWKWVA